MFEVGSPASHRGRREQARKSGSLGVPVICGRRRATGRSQLRSRRIVLRLFGKKSDLLTLELEHLLLQVEPLRCDGPAEDHRRQEDERAEDREERGELSHLESALSRNGNGCRLLLVFGPFEQRGLASRHIQGRRLFDSVRADAELTEA